MMNILNLLKSFLFLVTVYIENLRILVLSALTFITITKTMKA